MCYSVDSLHMQVWAVPAYAVSESKCLFINGCAQPLTQKHYFDLVVLFQEFL